MKKGRHRRYEEARELKRSSEPSFNDLIDQNIRMSRELQRIGRVIGREGRMTERASLGPVAGS